MIEHAAHLDFPGALAAADARTMVLILAVGLSLLTALVLLLGRLYRRRVLANLRDNRRDPEPPLDIWREAGHRVAVADDPLDDDSADSDGDIDDFTPDDDDDPR